MTDRPAAADWTAGPAKWAAVVVLGGACAVGLATALLDRASARSGGAAGPAASPPATTQAGPGAPSGAANAGGPLVGRLDLNTATIAQLEALPGIGPAIATAIVQRREQVGRFGSIEELDAIRGIGAKRLEQLRPFLMVGPPAAP